MTGRGRGCLCFPFSTIQYGPQEVVSCQAAHAASNALTILENLYRFAGLHDPSYHVPAVVTFTCSGPTVRIWTAYSLPSSDGKPVHVSIDHSEMT